jgi:S-layer protein
MKKANRSLKNKKTRSSLRVEALEQRQLLAAITGQGTEVLSNVVHSNGNVYDQVLMTGSSVTVTADAGQVTRVSFLDLQGDIVQAEFSGAGSMTISLDSFVAAAVATKYAQPGVSYVSGLASFTIQGSDASTNFSTFSVGTSNAHRGVDNPIFAGGLTGGNNYADVARLAIVADPSNASGSTFGGIRAGNAIFSAASGTVGIAAANVQIQDVVTIGDIAATGTGTPTLVFGTNSQFSNVTVAGGDLVQANSVAINNAGSYGYKLVLAAGTTSAGTALAAQPVSDTLSFTGTNPTNVGGLTFTLTSGIDTFTGGSAKDTFIVNDPAHLGSFESLTGGEGTDTLRIVSLSTSAGLGGSYTTANSTVTGIENVEIQTAHTTDIGVTLSSMTGLNKVTITNTGSATALTTSANATEVTVVGLAAKTVGITDAATTDKLATATVSGSTTGLVTITSGALSTVNLSTTSTATGGLTVVGAASARTLNLNGVTANAVVTDSAATSITINSTGVANVIDASAAAATSVTINATGANITFNDLVVTAATKLTLTGSKAISVTDASPTVTALTAIDASVASGAVLITAALGTGVAYTGSAGADTISLAGASTKAITLGLGDDTVTLATALGTAGTLDGGEGTDTIAVTATLATTLDNDAVFSGQVSSLEKLSLSAIAAESIDLSKIDGISYVVATGASGAFGVTKMADGGTLELTGNTGAGGSHTVTMTSATGLSDTFNIKVTGAAAVTARTVAVAGVETLNINSDDTATSPGGTFQHTLTVTDSSAKTITITGDAGMVLTNTDTAVTSFDASGVTKGNVTWTSGVLAAAATVTGSQGADALDTSASTKAMSVSAGAGNDTITTGTGADVIYGGAGNETINASNGANTVYGEAGNDGITTGTGADIIDGGVGNDTISSGDGADTIIAGDGVDSVTSGSGLDLVTLGAGDDIFYATLNANGNTYATITDFAIATSTTVGDTINLSLVSAGTIADATVGAKISLASTAAFADYLNAASSNGVLGGGNSLVTWFQYGGDTYIVVDSNNTDAFISNVTTGDQVIKLQGLIDLNGADITSEAVTVPTP